MNILSVDNWCVYQQQKPIIDQWHLKAQAGDIIALTGPSGCGKTTLLHSLSLIHRPSCGSLTINEDIIHFKADSYPAPKKIQSMRKHLGMVLQHYALWPHMTVLENIIAAPIYVQKQSKKQAIAEAQHWLNRLDLAPLQQHYPKALSGGQQQRVAIARSLILEPNILLLDEPTAALDIDNSNSLGHILHSFAHQGKIIIFSSHDLAFIEKFSNQKITLQNQFSPIHKKSKPITNAHQGNIYEN